MKRIVFAAVAALALSSAGAYACPAGTHITGGTGPYHKGGSCVAGAGTSSSAKSHASKKVADTKSKVSKAKESAKAPVKKVTTATKPSA